MPKSIMTACRELQINWYKDSGNKNTSEILVSFYVKIWWLAEMAKMHSYQQSSSNRQEIEIH